ncbi:glycosyltransferase [Halocatena marina]
MLSTTEAMSADRLHVLWLTPDKPEHISVGRRRIAEQLRQQGYDVTLRGTTLRTLFAALRERGQYDLVIGTTRAGAIAGTTLTLVDGPLIVDHVDPIRQFEATHPWWLSGPVRWLEQFAFTVADHVLYVYSEEKERVERFASAASKTDLGVAYERFADPPDEIVATARSKLSAFDSENILIYVGGLESIYHISDLLAAMRQLDDWTLVVLGTGSLEPEVQRAAQKHSNVSYLGTVPHEEVPGYLHAATVGVCLVDDPHTLKVLEYGAAGLPVVQLAGRAEPRFEDRVTFCEPTPSAIAHAVRTAAQSTEPESLQTFVQQFDFEEIAADYANAIAQAVDAHGESE